VRSNYKEKKQKNKLPEKSRHATLKSRFPEKKRKKNQYYGKREREAGREIIFHYANDSTIPYILYIIYYIKNTIIEDTFDLCDSLA